jgi:poly(A) polymerase
MVSINLQKVPNNFFHVEKIDKRILSIHDELVDNKFDCFLVGGCIRDLLSQKVPKDFDLVTNATPDQIIKVFKKRSRLIGKRFPIVHVRKGNLIVEVSTFRSSRSLERDYGKSGIILRDEAWGNLEEDVLRRDFTINALFYDPRRNEIIDYLGGLDHIKQKKVMFIGPPIERIKEDPIRMLRAIRFSAKLGTPLNSSLASSIRQSCEQINSISRARLFDEFRKLFLGGYALSVWNLISKTSLPRLIWPECHTRDPIITIGLTFTDRRFKESKTLSPAFIIALLLWSKFNRNAAHSKSINAESIAKNILKRQNNRMSIPVRYREFVSSIWLLQAKLEARQNKGLIKNRAFRAAYDFLVVRGESDPSLMDLINFWKSAQKSGRKTY